MDVPPLSRFNPSRPWVLTSSLGKEWSESDFGLQIFEKLATMSVFVKDREYRFVYGNTSFLRLMGLRSLDALLFKTDNDFSPTYLINKYRHDDDAVLSTGSVLSGIIELVPNRESRYEWVETTKIPIRSRSDEIIGLAGIIRQLTAVQANLDSLEELEPATRIILENYGQNLSLSKLAAMTSLSVSQFCKRFKATFGMSPHAYLVDLRLGRACELLRDTDLPISAIAEDCGFYDQSHLTNALSRHRGFTPKRYRERCREKEPVAEKDGEGAGGLNSERPAPAPGAGIN